MLNSPRPSSTGSPSKIAACGPLWSARSAQFADADHGLRAGDGGRISYTTNGGSAWATANVPLDVRGYLRGIHFLPGATPAWQVAWAVGDDGVVLRSTDAGVNWSHYGVPVMRDASTAASLFDGYFFDLLTGWVVGLDGVIQHTSDGGQTWTPTSPPCHMNDCYQITFLTPQVGVIASEYGIVVRTTDGGLNWTCQDLDNLTLCPAIPGECATNIEIWGMDFFDSNRGYLAAGVGTNWGYLFSTSNGGATWRQDACVKLSPAPTPCAGCAPCACPQGTPGSCVNVPTMYGMAATSLTNAVAVGYGSTVLRRQAITAATACANCTVGATGWEQTNVPAAFSNPPLNVACRGGSRVFYGGTFNIVRRSDDGGVNFTNQAGTEYLRVEDGTFVNSSTGFLVGQALTILRTTDGGASLQQVLAPDLCAMCLYWQGIALAAGNSAGIVVGDSGMCGYTTDGGASWTKVATSFTTTLRGVAFTPSGAALAVGDNGTIVGSLTGGATWFGMPGNMPTNVHLYAVVALSDSTAVVVGGLSTGGGNFARRAYLTTNFGTNWAPLNFAGGTSSILLHDIAVRGSDVYVVGDLGEVYRWQGAPTNAFVAQNLGITPAPTDRLRAVILVPGDDDVYAVGDNGLVLRQDGGTWTMPKSQTTHPLVGGSFFDGTTGFVVGRRTGVFEW